MTTEKEILHNILKNKGSQMEFTGERFVPGHPELVHLFQEHVIRYLFASQFINSKIVLDAGCGTGYGSYILAQKGAKKVVGIDSSHEAIEYCNENYKGKNLEFRTEDCTKLNFSDNTFDVVVSFEVIEHLEKPELFLAEMDRVLNKDGILIILTPNKLTYTNDNPFHYQEFTENELRKILEETFSNVSIFYQSYPSTLAISQSGIKDGIQELDIQGKQTQQDKSALYFVAVCSNKKTTKISSKLFLFDEPTLILENYPRIQNNLLKLKEDSLEKDAIFTKLKKEFQERTEWAKKLDQELREKNEQITHLQKEFQERTEWAKKLDQELREKNEQNVTFQKVFTERSEWTKILDEELLEKYHEHEKQISNLKTELQTRSSELSELQSKLYELNNNLEQISQSIIYRTFKKVTNGLDKIFPPSTRRGEKLRLARTAYLTYKNEGFDVLLAATKQKYGVKLKTKQQKSSKNLPSFLTRKTKNFILESTKIFFEINHPLQSNLKFSYGNINSLLAFPKISIIITTYNQVHHLTKNIESIKLKSTYKNFEIIIVTNNTDPNSEIRKFLDSIDCKYYVYEKEYSFSEMNNFGASKAEGEFLLFLNDDVEVENPNWLEAFLQLGLKKSVGAVGAKLLFPNHTLQEAGCIVWKRGNAWNYGRNDDPQKPEYNFVRDVDYCSGSSLFVKKQIFEKIGGFDSGYHPAYCEDVDLCFKIRKLGYRVLYQPQACVIHHEGSTQGTNVRTGIKSYQILNQKKLTKKWKTLLNSHLDDSQENSLSERDRQKGINILFIDHYVPEPDKDSGSLRTFRILNILRYLGNRITFWPENLLQTQPYTNELQQKGIEVIYGPKNFSKFLDERKDFYDLAIISRPYITSKFIDIIKSKTPNCILIYETSDLHFLRAQRELKLGKKTISKKDIEKLHDLELTLMKKCDLTILTSKEEAKILHKEDESLKFALIPNINLQNDNVPNFDERKDMMFLGGFQHPPNIDSAEYLVNEIFPKIKQKLPNIKLYVVGSNPIKKIAKLASEDIVVTGYVKNIDEYLDKCRVMLAPLRFGAGIKGKITQSLARGLPVITSSIGAEGIDLKDGESCMIADDPSDFANKAIQVYNDKDLWEKLSKNGIEVSKNYSPETVLSVVERLLSEISN